MRTAKNNKPPQKPLSDLAVRKLKPGDKPRTDTGEYSGLRVTCGAGGTKTFFYRYKSPVTGRLTQVKIGNYPATSLAQARAKLVELKSARKDGRCPAREVRVEKEAELQRAALEAQEVEKRSFTFADMLEQYLSGYIEDRFVGGKRVPGARVKKGQQETRRTLESDPIIFLGHKPAGEVTRQDIIALVASIVGRGANVQAGNVLREVTAAYEYAIGLDKFDENFANPAVLAKASLARSKIKLTSERGQRYLSDPEIRSLLEWLPGSVFTPTQKNVLRFALWTGCRTGEVCTAKWQDIDLKKSTWHLRATKTGAERFVQLSRQAVEFLQQLRLQTGDYLFPSQKTGKPIQQKSLTEQAWHLRQSHRMLDIDHWTPHDLRRTVRTGLSRLGCPAEVAEAVLGHARVGIEGTYDLHRYERECRHWLQIWADHLDSLSGREGE